MDGMTINHFLWVLTMAHITRSCIFSDQVDSLLYNSLPLNDVSSSRQRPRVVKPSGFFGKMDRNPRETIWLSPESIYMQRHQDMDVTLW